MLWYTTVMINKDTILQAKKDGKVLFFKNLFTNVPNWNVFFQVYRSGIDQKTVKYYGPGTANIDNAELIVKDFDAMIDYFNDIHPGNKIAALAINHFLSANDRTVPEAASEFYKLFVSDNPNKIPNDFNFNLLQPTRHSDPVDGFFVQCNGNTRWRVFYADGTDIFDVEPGDALYIPKGIEHSVETMTVRSSVSISFYDN